MSSNKRLRRQPTPGLSLYRQRSPSKRSEPLAPRRRLCIVPANTELLTAIPTPGWKLRRQNGVEALLGAIVCLTQTDRPNEKEVALLAITANGIMTDCADVTDDAEAFELLPPS